MQAVSKHLKVLEDAGGFEAPQESGFGAHTEPELVSQLLGPRDLVMTIDHYNCRTGGTT